MLREATRGTHASAAHASGGLTALESAKNIVIVVTRRHRCLTRSHHLSHDTVALKVTEVVDPPPTLPHIKLVARNGHVSTSGDKVDTSDDQVRCIVKADDADRVHCQADGEETGQFGKVARAAVVSLFLLMGALAFLWWTWVKMAQDSLQMTTEVPTSIPLRPDDD